MIVMGVSVMEEGVMMCRRRGVTWTLKGTVLPVTTLAA